MKKMFQIVGIITLLFGSFIYTEEVATTSKLSDELLNEIKVRAKDYKVDSIESIIKNDTIIPGVDGKQVDIKKSYEKMRQIGYFNDKLLVYKEISVKEKLKDNKDKYIISANPSKKEVALLFKVDKNDDLNNIVYVLNKKKVKGTFYITSDFLEANHNYVIRLIQSGHNFGNLSYNEDYTNSDFVWMRTILTSTKEQKNNYCYTEKPNKEILKICNIQNSYTIIPTIVIKDRPSITIKQNLSPGSIISLDVNKSTISELEYIVNYVESKGYRIKNLEKILDL